MILKLILALFRGIRATVKLLIVAYLFGYLELVSGGYGFLLGIPFVLFPSPIRRRCYALAIYACELCCLRFVDKYISFLLFFALVIYSTRHTDDSDDNSEVNVDFKPYESEIRHFLMKTDPSKLHLVDDMLLKYRGDGEELLETLKEEYKSKELVERKQYIRRVVRHG